MTDEQYKELIRQLGQVLDNQVILGNKLNSIQADVETIISNQKILGNDQDKLIEDVQKIKRAINK